MADVEKIKEALLHGLALHSRVLGAKADKDMVDKQAGIELAAARKSFDELGAKYAARLKDEDAKIAAAEKELADYQEKIRQELGIVLDLAPRPVGGQTRL